jgi:hypothetical protein
MAICRKFWEAKILYTVSGEILEAVGIEPTDGRIGSPRWNHPAPTLPTIRKGELIRFPFSWLLVVF